MSVLIRGMKMPTSCDDCFLPLQYCPYAMQPNGECPLVPVPPHGRLIDADAFFDDLLFPSKQFEQGMKELVADAPTIIPASEEGAKAEEDTEPWLCLSCRHYPPSSTDGKPCTQCNPIEVWHSCYDPAEEVKTDD